MANLQERCNKDGKLVSYSIRVHKGFDINGQPLKPYSATFKVSPNWSEKTAKKKAQAFAASFEEKCRAGLASDDRRTFEEFSQYTLSLKEQRGDKHSTIADYRRMVPRIYEVIGHIKMRDLRPAHINALYTALSAEGVNQRTGGKLSATTVKRYHRWVSIVCQQAVKEGLIPFNPASRAEPPKVEKKEPNYLQPETIQAVFEALKSEPIKWQMIVEMLLATGCRRGELLGLKWKNVDFDNSRIYICNTVLYTADRGVYESTPKTKSSVRYIELPHSTTQSLKKYRSWQAGEIMRLGAYYERLGFVFSQDNGQPMRPDSITAWLNRFSKRHNLPHLNPHAFRHSMTSLLIFGGADLVSVSKRLGHSLPSTTANIYAHALAQADAKNAEVLDMILCKNA